MKSVLVTSLITTCFMLSSTARALSAEVCRHCNSSKCTSCTVQVGVYGYTRPTWRPWPTAKEDEPGERERTDRQLIRPKPFETPTPETEADGAPSLTPPDTLPPGFEPMPPDDAPALPPELRNKQPIPVEESSRRPPVPRATTISQQRSMRANAPKVAASKPKVSPLRRSRPVPQPQPASGRVVSLNIPISAQLSVGDHSSNNPLRLANGSSLSKPMTARRAAANMPVAVTSGGQSSSKSKLPESNPLR
ncbi:MAG: hypothetical protein MI757_04180 [Pirellulales bacterium]|nr:hypothetical protein [Pirellulales bacterium]